MDNQGLHLSFLLNEILEFNKNFEQKVMKFFFQSINLIQNILKSFSFYSTNSYLSLILLNEMPVWLSPDRAFNFLQLCDSCVCQCLYMNSLSVSATHPFIESIDSFDHKLVLFILNFFESLLI